MTILCLMLYDACNARLIIIVCGTTTTISDSEIERVLHLETLSIHEMLEREVWLDVVIMSYAILFSIVISPVFGIVTTILIHLCLR